MLSVVQHVLETIISDLERRTATGSIEGPTSDLDTGVSAQINTCEMSMI
jgi:hypothetical protein